MKKDIRAIKKKMQMAQDAANLMSSQSNLKLGIFRPQIPLMPLFLKEKQTRPDLNEQKVEIYASNFPNEETVNETKDLRIKAGTYQFMSWRKFLTSNNLFTINYKFNQLQLFSNCLALGVLSAAHLLQPYLILKFLGSFYGIAVFLNNAAERYVRTRCIDKIYLIMATEQVPEAGVVTNSSGESRNSNKEGGQVSGKIEIHMINGKVYSDLYILDNVKLLEKPSKDPERKLISKIKLTLTEMYVAEYYESLTKNFVQLTKEQKMLLIFYNTKPKLGQPSAILDQKLLEAVLGGTEIEVLSH